MSNERHSDHPLVLILFGAPGVGKGTQAQLLARKLHIAHLSTGDAFRNAIEAQTEIGKKAQQYVNAGELVPDEIVSRIVEEEIKKPQYQKGIIFDGFPRTLAQAKALNRMLQQLGMQITAVITIEVPEEEILNRLLQRGRKDDTPEVIRHRLQLYRKETAPLLDYYRNETNIPVFIVDGNADIETVNKRIMDVLQRKAIEYEKRD